jgi:hypothetical protein
MNFLQNSAQPLPCRPTTPAGHRIPARPTRPQPRWRKLLKVVFSSALRTPAETSSLSHVTTMWARLSASSPSPRWPTVAASSRRLRPPRAARPPTSGCQVRSSLQALIPPLTPHQAAPPSMALRPLPSVVSPSPALACPSPATIKG